MSHPTQRSGAPPPSERPAESPSRHHSAGHHDNSLTTRLAEWAARYAAAKLLWRDQPVDVHVFIEKDAISGVILPVTEQWDVPLGVLRGYCSETFAHLVAESIWFSSRPTFVYQLGGHDPSWAGRVARFPGDGG